MKKLPQNISAFCLDCSECGLYVSINGSDLIYIVNHTKKEVTYIHPQESTACYSFIEYNKYEEELIRIKDLSELQSHLK